MDTATEAADCRDLKPYVLADPRLSYGKINAIAVQAMGRADKPASINPRTGILGNRVDNRISFKKVPDPVARRKSAFVFQVAQRDLNTFSEGAKRVEMAWSPSTHGYLPGTTYWSAFRVMLTASISNTSPKDEVIIWQTHDASGEPGLSPNLAIVAHGGRARAGFTVQIRYADSNYPSLRDNIKHRTVYNTRGKGLATGKWITFVTQFRLQYTEAGGPFFKLWRDGKLVVDDNLPNDYNAGQDKNLEKRAYQKLGIYHYSPEEWSPGDLRSVYHKGIRTYVDDPLIDENCMRRLIESH